MQPEDILDVWQGEVFERVLSDSWLSDVALLRRDVGVIDNDVKNSLGTYTGRAGKTGATIVIMQPTLAASNEEAPGPQLTAQISLRVLEYPTVNRRATGTGLTASMISLRLVRLLHLVSVDLLPGGTMRVDRSPVRPAAVGDLKTVGYDVRMQFDLGFDGGRIVAPRITQAGELVTISCNTPGVEIWYTTDGSYPRPSNEAATKYASPISSPASGTVVRAGAYLGERIPSSITQLVIQ